MSRRTYPRFRRRVKDYRKMRPRNRPQCAFCGAPAVARIEYEVSFMRGDDEQVKVCEFHLGLAKANEWSALDAGGSDE